MSDHHQRALAPSELSPLLVSQPPALPSLFVDSVVASVRAKGVSLSTPADWCPRPLASRPQEIAFSLVVLLHLRISAPSAQSLASNVWEQWREEERDTALASELDRRIIQFWQDFVKDDRTEEEIEDVLWTVFPISFVDQRTLRVADLLAHREAPTELLTHRLVFFSICNTWKCGHFPRERASTILARVFRRVDAACTPRVAHMLSLLSHLAYLALLAYFVLAPPTRDEISEPPPPGLREALLAILAVSRICQPWTVRTIPYILVLLAFLASLPTVPFPDSFAYSILLFSFAWNILELHLPLPPSPIYLLPFSQMLPLSTIVYHGLARIFLPVTFFFLPALLLSLFLLSTSLSDVLAMLTSYYSFRPAPMETRVAFVSLITVLFLMLLCTLVMLVLVYPFLSSADTSSTWDRYSVSIGLEARRLLVRTVATYSAPYSFPPPLNLAQLVMVRLPRSLSAILGRKEIEPYLNYLERILWRILVAPFACVLAGVWFLGRKARIVA